MVRQNRNNTIVPFYIMITVCNCVPIHSVEHSSSCYDLYTMQSNLRKFTWLSLLHLVRSRVCVVTCRLHPDTAFDHPGLCWHGDDRNTFMSNHPPGKFQFL
jgi:hypothetical protein